MKKIKHPFQLPDNFFDDFKNEMINDLNDLPQKGRIISRNFMLQFSKYAAIVVFSFFLGRASISILNNDNKNANYTEYYSVDEVMLQITDEDIANFIVEDDTLEL